MLKGWKTILFNLAIAAFGVLQAVDWIDVLGSRTTSIEAASRTEVSALRAELQARNERTLEGQRLLSEQIIEQRGDVKAIRATLERFERQLERAGSLPRSGR